MDEARQGGGVARTVNLWAQTIAILAAGVWGVYTFVYLEIAKPAAAPINLSTQISVREAGRSPTQPEEQGLLAIELEVTASNPSTRTVYLLSNYWRATGVKVAPRADGFDWVAAANQHIDSRTPGAAGEHYRLFSGTLVASGSVMPDTELKPNESVSRSYVFYVAQGEYDLLDVESVVPSVSRKDTIAIVWTVQADGVVAPQVYRIDENGERVAMTAGEDGRFMDESVNLQTAESRRQLSLWSASQTREGD
jgi:hypothetical protein